MRLTLGLALCIAALTCGTPLPAAEARSEEQKVLAAFTDENKAIIDYCFSTFCAAVTAKDARVAAAFIAELPKPLAGLDFTKEPGKAQLLRTLARFDGASGVKSQRFHGMGEVTYTDKAGTERTQRMQFAGGVWKIVEP
jgi:hypothetical protein